GAGCRSRRLYRSRGISLRAAEIEGLECGFLPDLDFTTLGKLENGGEARCGGGAAAAGTGAPVLGQPGGKLGPVLRGAEQVTHPLEGAFHGKHRLAFEVER